MKLTVEYDPNHGYVQPDGKTEAYTDRVIQVFLNQSGNQKITVASGLFVDFFRLRLLEGAIDKDQIEFMFEGVVLEHNSYAAMKKWPKGFCDTSARLLTNLLTLASKKRKNKLSKMEEDNELTGLQDISKRN